MWRAAFTALILFNTNQLLALQYSTPGVSFVLSPLGFTCHTMSGDSRSPDPKRQGPQRSVPTRCPRSDGRSHAAGGGVVVYLSRLYDAPEGPAP